MKSDSPATLSYPRCERVSNIRNHNNELSKFIFTEFSAGLITVCRFQNEIKLFETEYELVALVKHIFKHLFKQVQKCVLLDDFQDLCVDYGSLSDLPRNNNIDCFFGVYQQKREVAMTSSGFKTSFARTPADCHQNIKKVSGDRTKLLKVVLRLVVLILVIAMLKKKQII